MKKLLLLLIFVVTINVSFAQTQVKKDADTQNYETFRYRLFPTTNIWTFIKLDTRNGLMWQVQWNTEKDKRFETYLNLLPLIPTEQEKNGRFILYPTQNIYNFILLDQSDGRTWQVQWSSEVENRVVVPITKLF